MEVHKNLGPGFLEPVYQEALKIEMEERNIPFIKEALLDIFYKGKIMDKRYLADFICYKEIIIELKACEKLIPSHISQVVNYLKATDKPLGLLINFGSKSLQYKRVILN